MQLSRNLKTALVAFLVFDLLVASWLVYLWLLSGEVDEINELRDLGATRYPEPRAVADFELLDQQGNSFTQAELAGHWTLVFFGFTSCPDICPLTMTELAQFSRRFSEQEGIETPEVLFVTVDPDRDGVEEVAAYMSRFDESFTGLTGMDADIREVAAQFFVTYSSDESDEMHGAHPQPVSNPDDYGVSHNAHVSLVNPLGQLHSVIRPPIRSEVLLELYPRLIAE